MLSCFLLLTTVTLAALTHRASWTDQTRPRRRPRLFRQQLRLRFRRRRHRDLAMIYPHRQMSDQRTLDVPNHLLGRQLRRGQHVNLIDGSAVSRDYPRRDHTRQSKDQLLRTLDWEDAASDW